MDADYTQTGSLGKLGASAVRFIALHDRQEIPYMIIGGQAVLLYDRPRLTRDIDITLGVDTDKFALIESSCKTLKLKILAENARDFAQDTSE